MSSSADRNLLFGVFALQMDFLTRDQLVEGMQAWVLEKSQPLEDILVGKGILAASDRDLLLPLVSRHLKQHGGDPEKSLRAISSVTESVKVLKSIDDGDVQHSLASLKLREPSPEGDSPATVTFKPDFGQRGTRYVSIRPHAKGGLGEVFIARDTELDREVALKEIQQHHAHETDSRSRFLMEAEITGKLEHPGIVPVYGLGHYPDGRPFYAMRFIRGDSLHQAIQEFHKNQTGGNLYESVAFRKLLGRFVDVCNAVGYAHSRGVLHRDLKPGNVMLGKHGETLVVDWGLAKVKGRGESSSVGEVTLQVSSGSGTDQTLPGSAIGTPGYMSPEQAEGQLSLLGPATDIYGLGATLYTLLTGKKPIAAPTLHEVLRQTVKGEFPKPRSYDLQIPKALEAICLKAMALAPTDRYPTCQALADDVERFLADESVTALHERFFARVGRFARHHRSAVQAAGIALVLVTAIATGAALLINEQRHRAELLADEKTELATKEKQARKAAERLASEKGELAIQESLARNEAERHATDAKKQLARNYFTHGLAEDAAGRQRAGLFDFCRAWATCPSEDSQRKSYAQVLVDRATMRGQAMGLLMLHQGHVNVVAFSPDGERMLTGSHDHTARLWDARTGVPLGEAMQHGDYVTAVAFSPDGERMLTGSYDHTARLWDARSGASLGEMMRHEGWVNSAVFSPDGERVLTGSHDDTARLWNGRTGAPLGEAMRHEGYVAVVAFSPDGERVLTGSADHTARLWNARTGAPLGESMRHEGSVHSVVFSPDGERVLTGSADHTARLWNALTGAPLGKPLRHNDAVFDVAFNPDGQSALTSSGDHTTRLWDAGNWTPLGEPMRHENFIYSVAFSPDGDSVLTGSGNEARLWNARTGALLADLKPHEGDIVALAFSPDGQRVLTGSMDKSARLWDARAGVPLGEFTPHDRSVIALAFSPDGKRVLAGSDGFRARLWDAQTGLLSGEGMPHDDSVYAVAFSPDGERVLTGSKDQKARLWDARTGAPLGEPMSHEDTVVSVAFSPDGERVMTGSGDKLQLWNARTGAPLGKPQRHEDPLFAVAFCPDGERVLTLGSDNTAQLRDAKTGKPLGQRLRLEGSIYSAAFSPDGERVLTGSGDEARLWNARTGAPLGEAMRHKDSVYAVAFSPDAERVMTGSGDRTARLWDGRTGAPLGEPLLHEDAVYAVAFSPDGELVLTGCRDQIVRLWIAPFFAFPETEHDAQLWVELASGLAVELVSNVDPRPFRMAEWNTRWRDLERNAGQFLMDLGQRSIRRSISGHRFEAKEAEDAGHWFAAEFHLRALLKIEPENEGFKGRYHRAVGELALSKSANEWRNSASTPQPAVAERPQ